MEQLFFFACRETGVWINFEYRYRCKDCGFWYLDQSKKPYRFCPQCGREMIVKRGV